MYDKSIIIISYLYGNRLSKNTSFQTTKFERTNKHVTGCLNLEVKE